MIQSTAHGCCPIFHKKKLRHQFTHHTVRFVLNIEVFVKSLSTHTHTRSRAITDADFDNSTLIICLFAHFFYSLPLVCLLFSMIIQIFKYQLCLSNTLYADAKWSSPFYTYTVNAEHLSTLQNGVRGMKVL